MSLPVILKLMPANQKQLGFYSKHLPVVCMKFNGVDGALPILLYEANMVEAVKNGLLSLKGSLEYIRDIGNFMVRLQELMM